MSFLDMKTVVFAFLIYNILISGILVSLWFQNRKRYDGISFWLADYILQAIAQLLIVLRGYIPDFISMVISNTMVIMGIIFFYIGLRRFTGRKGRESWLYLYIPAFMAVQAYFTFFMPSLTFRSMNTSAGILVFSLLSSIFMLSIPNRELRVIGRGTGIVFLLYCFVALFRIVFLMLVPQSNDYFKAGLFDVLSIFVFMILGVMLTFALILMINGRLLLEIRGLLGEKELLLTEVHHRIKNNMASISSLLSIQADMSDSESTKEALTAAKNRTYAMMDLYDRLYRQSEYDSLSIKDYLTSMVSELRAAYNSDGTVRIDLDIDDIILTTRQLFPLGIIINELVTNAFKYAFAGIEHPMIILSLHKQSDGSLAIIISDNGSGIKDDERRVGGFGLVLVATLIKQIGGTYTVSPDRGTRYTITIPGEKK